MPYSKHQYEKKMQISNFFVRSLFILPLNDNVGKTSHSAHGFHFAFCQSFYIWLKSATEEKAVLCI